MRVCAVEDCEPIQSASSRSTRRELRKPLKDSGVKVKQEKAPSHQSFIATRRHREARFAVLGTDQSGATESTFAERKGLSAVGREPRPKGPVE
jgi:hypothetical protein